jgi:hypothetical protein
VNTAPCSQQIAALRLSGAHRLEPVRFHYLELLAQRAQTQPERVRRILEARLAQALAEWRLRHEGAHADCSADAPGQTTQAPVQSGLRGLLDYLAQHAPQAVPQAVAEAQGLESLEGLEGGVGTRTELKSVRHFRNTWSRLSADRQLALALDQAPKNAGPINSHMLVLRSLALMREISPDYLNRFISYADTLLCLEHSEQVQQAASRVDREGGSARKARPRRSR